MSNPHTRARRIAVAAAVGLWLAWAAGAWAQPLPAGAEQAANRFLYAFSRNDRETIAAMIPKQPKNLFGPCPFDRMPSLFKPRADGRVGAVEFQGKMTDPGLPAKGIVILRLMQEGDAKVWRVRQIYWYDELPQGAEIPERSPTDEDRQQEPRVWEAAKLFIHYWLRGNYEEMEGMTFRWWEVHRRPPKWVRMTRVELTARPTTLDGIRVDFRAKLKILRILPRSVRGNIWLVKEDGVWRVRPITFAFFF